VDGKSGALSPGWLGGQAARWKKARLSPARFNKIGRLARQPRPRVIAIGTVIVAVAAGGATYALTRGGPPPAAAAHHASAVAVPLRVISISPAAGSSDVSGLDPVRVTFSTPLAAGSPRPQIRPGVPGSWQSFGDTLVFTPAMPFGPSRRVTVAVPAGPGGVRSASGSLLAQRVAAQFHTAAFSPLRLSQLLAQLGYLPMSWRSSQVSGKLAAAGQPQGSGLAAQMTFAYSPPPGTFTFDSGYPSLLASMWRPGQFNVILKGAVMAFQSEHNMALTGVPSSGLWQAVLKAAAAGQRNRNGYTYAIANKGSPETLTIWHNGQQVLRSLANTGIPASPTVDGTFPVYLRFRYTIMSGFNPDGSYYSDPVQFVSYFNGGDAVHYFLRATYGWPQSLGCVELPYGDAAQAWPYLTYGSLVSVTG
jgi:peptidoglycan hydrolase-like protein with peptidoglycan-binding domain